MHMRQGLCQLVLSHVQELTRLVGRCSEGDQVQGCQPRLPARACTSMSAFISTHTMLPAKAR